MNNINNILLERDCIIDSMSYFNPLILEEHNTIVTEGIVGGIVEKLKALYELIKGWIKKLIDFIASKFSRGKKGGKVSAADNSQAKEKSSEGGNEVEQIQKATQEIAKEKEEVKKVNEKVTKKAEEVSKKAKEVAKKEEDIKKKNDEQKKKEMLQEIEKEKERLRNNIEECKKDVEKIKKRMSSLPKRIKEQENKIAKLKNNEIGYDVKRLKVPDLKNAKNAINDIMNDCKKAIMTDNPYENFRGKTIKMYFLKSNKELDMLLRDFLQNKDFASYNYDAGQDCVDQLRKYEKSVDATYNNLQQRASHISTANKNEADKILNKAKGVNQITQQVLKGAVTILSGYVDRIGSLRSKYGVSTRNNASVLKSEEVKLQDMKEDYMDLYKDQLSYATKRIKECESELSALS